MSQPTARTYKKKLIEVALPLEAINRESAREKSIRHGHPSTLHLWWARRPLAACRAVLFASLVDDPSAHSDRFPTEEAQQAERERLFRIIEQLVLWENSNSDTVLDAARREILASTDGNPPPVLDPFCGGGSIPLEAQRLGLEAHASDLNPVAVLITKALIEIPPKFANRPPVNPASISPLPGAGEGPGVRAVAWRGAAGLAADVRYYGKWMRDEAERRIGHLYPKVRLPAERGGDEATVIAWLWARTVTCPNPACGARMPLVRSFALSTKKGKEAWVEPVVEYPSLASPLTPLPSPTRGEGREAEVRWAIAEPLRQRMVEIAREFRKVPTRSEAALWEALRGQQLDGIKFRRQQPIGPFVVDFYAPEHRLVVEIDGGVHTDQQERDRERQALLEALGLSFVRLPAETVEQDLGSAIATIRTALPSPPDPHSHKLRGGNPTDPRLPSPLVGEGPGERGPRIRFEVHTGGGTPPEGTVNRKGARCLACGTSVPFDHVRSEGRAGRMDAQLVAIVAEGQHERIYLSSSEEHVRSALQARPRWAPDTDLPEQALGFRVQLYGLTKHQDLFTPRQLLAVTTFTDLVGEAWSKVVADASGSQSPGNAEPLADGGCGAPAYADAAATYLAFAVDRLAESDCALARWQSTGDFVAGAFGRPTLSMLWDFAEVNPFSNSTRNFGDAVEWVAESLETVTPVAPGSTTQHDAAAIVSGTANSLISTDPPYYDNVGYADLSDFFYVWLRHSLGTVYPTLFSTLLTPKTPELIASPYRFGGDREQAEHFFEDGLGKAFRRMHAVQHPDYPLTVYYAFKQAESDDGGGDGTVGTSSTGWETMLEGLIRAGFAVNGTWPMRTERAVRPRQLGSNALASSIVLVCRPRPDDAPLATRAEFHRALRRELPGALRRLQQGAIAPVDLAQAAIGPGMAVYSRYSRVLEPSGQPLRVRSALQLINQVLDEVLTEQEGEFDADTRWAVAWFEQHGTGEGPYGDAETLSKAKDCAVGGLVEAGIVKSGQGKVRLLRRDELDPTWNPLADRRLTVWEVTQHLMRALTEGGEDAAALILGQVGGLGDAARDPAYRLYTTCERRGWASEALDYNALVVAWSGVQGQLRPAGGTARQATLM